MTPDIAIMTTAAVELITVTTLDLPDSAEKVIFRRQVFINYLQLINICLLIADNY